MRLFTSATIPILISCWLLLSSVTNAEELNLNSDFLMFESDLASVYSKYGELPDFNKLQWCF